MKDTTTKQPEVKQSKWPLFLSVGIFVSAIVSYFAIPEVKQSVDQAYNILTSGDKARISKFVEGLGYWGPAFIILAMILQIFLLVVPSPLLMVVSVLAYGPAWGAILSVIAIFFSSTIGFFIGRYLGVMTIYKMIGEKKEKKMEFYIEKYGFWAVFVTRISPILSNDAISFVSGILKMNYWKFISATLAGIIPLAALIGYFGENNDRLKNGLLWVTGISVVLLIAYFIYDRKKETRQPGRAK